MMMMMSKNKHSICLHMKMLKLFFLFFSDQPAIQQQQCVEIRVKCKLIVTNLARLLGKRREEETP